MKSDGNVTIVIPLDQIGDIALWIVGPDGRPYKPTNKGKGSAIVLCGEVDAGFEGSGTLICLVLRLVKLAVPEH